MTQADGVWSRAVCPAGLPLAVLGFLQISALQKYWFLPGLHCNVASCVDRQRKTILQVFVERAFRLSYLEINLLAKGKLNQILFERKAAE